MTETSTPTPRPHFSELLATMQKFEIEGLPPEIEVYIGDPALVNKLGRISYVEGETHQVIGFKLEFNNHGRFRFERSPKNPIENEEEWEDLPCAVAWVDRRSGQSSWKDACHGRGRSSTRMAPVT